VCRPGKAALTALFLTFFLFTTQLSLGAASYNWKWSPQVAFRLPAYNTIINFNDWAYLNSFQFDTGNATSVKFTNFLIAGDDSPLSSFGLSVQNANCTVNYVNKQDKAEIVLSAPSGTVSSLTVYYPNSYPAAVAVGAETISNEKYLRSQTDWQLANPPAVYLNEANMEVKVKTQHSSSVVITLYWHGVSPTPGEGSTSSEGSTSGEGSFPSLPSPQRLPPVVVPPEAVPLVNIGLAVIVIVIAGSYAYSQVARQKTVSEKWKQRHKQIKPVEWKKKKSRFE